MKTYDWEIASVIILLLWRAWHGRNQFINSQFTRPNLKSTDPKRNLHRQLESRVAARSRCRRGSWQMRLNLRYLRTEDGGWNSRWGNEIGETGDEIGWGMAGRADLKGMQWKKRGAWTLLE